MGYESKLYVVEKSTMCELVSEDFPAPMYWGEVIAVFDLCKLPDSVSRKLRNYPNTDCYIYAGDGNTRITEDCYGDPLSEIPVPDAIRILKEGASHDNYRRYAPCIQLLEGFDLEQWRGLVVLHYGH